ncbi:MAG: FkbM family methyltransferase, partial [bacterium]
ENIIKKYAFKFAPKVFIETGTLDGDKVNVLNHLFLKSISIELDKKLYEKAKQRFKEYSNIEIIQGDSSVILPKILPCINETILFWLDAHYSGGITARGKNETPILNELKGILNYHPKGNLILIDDARLFIGKNDYPTIDELIDYLKKNGNVHYNYKIEKDIIIIQF